jgi:amino acid transporter
MSTKLFRKKSIDSIIRHAEENQENDLHLNKNLNVRDLTALGVAAIIGGGIFSMAGKAASEGGPAVSLLFIFTAFACGLSAMCYARFASVIPISGSAYTYAYASFGELLAWIIGWDLIMEYAVGNIAVAISWSDYFTSFTNGIGFGIPAYLSTDYLTASRGFEIVQQNLNSGIAWDTLSQNLKEAYTAWQTAPNFMGVRFIADIPAFTIVILITYLVFRGIYESKIAGNIMVLLKLTILMIVIGVGAFYVSVDNWTPFMPNGIGGVLKGVSGVFFAYIGFDAISTTAEECKDPQRDLPKSMIYSLIITTVLYVLVCLVLTGMVKYNELGVGDPLAYVFQKLHLTKLSGMIAIGAIIAMASVLLVFQVGQPRIWMSMSRDGLMPKIFSRLHPKYQTPWFSTLITGILVAVPSLFMNLTEVTDLTSIGTLFAFVLVSGGVLYLENQNKNGEFAKLHHGRKLFKIPYINGKYVIIELWFIAFFLLWYYYRNDLFQFFSFSHIDSNGLAFWDVLKSRILLYLYIIVAIVVTVLTILRNYSLIPVLGLLCNLYLMTELGITNWLRFLIWLVIGLVLYFSYGYNHSKIGNSEKKRTLT